MEDCGLTISKEEFMSLPQRQQMLTLYQNQADMRKETNVRFDQLEILIRGYKLHQRIQYAWLTAITGIGVWIITKYSTVIIPNLVGLISII